MADCSRWQPPRPCEAYRAEWKLCRSARHFLHHYYVHGERPACEQWRRDLASCRDWEERRSAEAQLPGRPLETLDFKDWHIATEHTTLPEEGSWTQLKKSKPKTWGIKDSFPQSFPGG
ncbi:synaptic plasticity regulator PANTS isoform X1 [Callithrix jacchus]|uniref:UPF0545 protein C22orf39 homolog isoform X1 n=1 Tax=Callithrix jacchus TaxID=9483 RepID=UPI0004F042F5|nr:UPF0545 protein C22orf39 homolog isoform X1 [Callithrix jacchus]